MARNRSCPVSARVVDEHVVRGIAIQVMLLAALALWLESYWIAGLLAMDFLSRAVGLPYASLLQLISARGVRLLNLPEKRVNSGAKQFAARMGTVVVLLFLFALINHALLPELLIGGMLVVFAALEGFFGICVGCYAYNWLPNG